MDTTALDPEVDDITSPTDNPTPEPTPKLQTSAEPDDLKKAMADLAAHVTKVTAPKEAPVTKTPEQLAEEWGVFDPRKVDEKFFHDFFGVAEDADPKVLERKMKLFGEMQKGMVKQAIMGALKVIRENDLKQLNEEYSPVREYVSSAKAEKTRERFFSTYPALRDSEGDGPKFSKVIDATARLLADKEFASEADYFKALAEGAAETIKGVFPTFDLGAAAAKPKTAGTTPRLPRTSVGGTGGTGGGGGKPTKTTDDDSGSIDW